MTRHCSTADTAYVSLNSVYRVPTEACQISGRLVSCISAVLSRRRRLHDVPRSYTRGDLRRCLLSRRRRRWKLRRRRRLRLGTRTLRLLRAAPQAPCGLAIKQSTRTVRCVVITRRRRKLAELSCDGCASRPNRCRLNKVHVHISTAITSSFASFALCFSLARLYVHWM